MLEDPNTQVSELPAGCNPPRFPVDCPGTLFLLHSPTGTPCHLMELGQTGCCVRLDQPFKTGAPTRIEIAFRKNGISFRLGGTAEPSSDRLSLSISFAALSARRQADLDELLRELEEDAAAQAAKKAAEDPQESAAEEQKTQNEHAEEVPMVSARMFVVPHGTDARQFETSVEPTPASSEQPSDLPSDGKAPIAFPTGADVAAVVNRAGKRERRTQRRHSVESRATVYLIDLGAQAEGLIVDVSLSGCRIQMDSRFSMGIYRRIEIGFMLDGLPFRLPGVTQAVHNKNTVGIRFLDLSERKREQLVQVIEEIDEMRGDGRL